MSIHKCALPQITTSGLPKLSPNASSWSRFARTLRRFIIVDPKNFRCLSLSLNKSAIVMEQKKHIQSPYNFMIHPFSKLSTILEVIFFSFWMMKLISDPVLKNMKEASSTVTDINDYLFLNMQTVLICSFFFLGYVDSATKEVVIDPRRVICRYLRTYFIFDLVAAECLRTMGLAGFSYFDMTPSWRVAKIIDYSHVVCLYVRLGTVLDYLDEIGQMLKMTHYVRKCVVCLVKTYMYLHFFSCLMYFVPNVVYDGDFPSDSWIIAAQIHPAEQARLFKIYGESFMLTMCYFFGASPGMYPISQTCEQICCSAITLFGRLYTLYLLAEVLSMFGVVGLSESSYEKKMAQLKEYMVSNDLPRALRSRMIRYYEYKLQKRHFNEPEILNTLSEHLRAEIFLHSARTLLHKSDVFRYLPQSEIAVLISMMRRETFAPGDILFKPEQILEDTYLICSGSVAILNRSKVELTHLEDGDIFGLMQWIFRENEYYALILETTDLYMIKAAEFFQFLEPFPQARDYMRLISKERNEMYRRMEDGTMRRTDTCWTELKTGRLLEKRRKKKVVAQ